MGNTLHTVIPHAHALIVLIMQACTKVGRPARLIQILFIIQNGNDSTAVVMATERNGLFVRTQYDTVKGTSNHDCNNIMQ